MDRLLLFSVGFLLNAGPVRAGLLDSANAIYGRGRIAQAVSLYKKAALAGENPALCYFNLANAYFQLDSVPQSIVYYRASLSHAPDFFRGHLNLAVAYYTLDDAGMCIASVKRALELEPGSEKALLVLAASYRKAFAYPEAITSFERLHQMNPELEEPPVALAELYRDLDDPETAVQWLARYPGSGKNRSYVNQLSADILERKGDLTAALHHLRNAFEADPDNKWAFYRMVVLLERLGNDLVALDEAKKGLELFPTFAELALLAGNTAFRQEDLDAAERFYTIARTQGSSAGVVGLENVRITRQALRVRAGIR